MKHFGKFFVVATIAICTAQANAQTTRTWYFPDGRIAAVLTFDANGFRTMSEVYGPSGKKGFTSLYRPSSKGGSNCRLGSAKYDNSTYSCLIGDVFSGGSNLIVFEGEPEESWGKHGVKQHAIFNGQKWTWYISGFNNDKSKPNLTIEEVIITDLNGKLIGNYVPAPDGNFMDNMFNKLPVAERPRYYMTTPSVDVNAAHFVPVVGETVGPPGIMPKPGPFTTERTWYFQNGKKAAVLYFEKNGNKVKSEVYDPSEKLGVTSDYEPTFESKPNCKWGSHKFNNESNGYSCLVKSVVAGGSNIKVIPSDVTYEYGGPHATKMHVKIDDIHWTWLVRGYNDDKDFSESRVMEAMATGSDGRTIAHFVQAPEGNFMDNTSQSLPVEKRPRYYLTTPSEDLKAAHFVPIQGDKVLIPEKISESDQATANITGTPFEDPKEPPIQPKRIWRFANGSIAATLQFDLNGTQTQSEVYDSSGRLGITSIYAAARDTGRNCRWGSYKSKSAPNGFSCLIGTSSGYGANINVFGMELEPWGPHGEKKHVTIDGNKWTWFTRGYNNDKEFSNLTVLQAVVTAPNGKIIADFVRAPEGKFMDNTFMAWPESKRPRYYLATPNASLKAVHFVPVIGDQVIELGKTPSFGPLTSNDGRTASPAMGE